MIELVIRSKERAEEIRVNYQNIIEGTFIERPNRFIAYVWVKDKQVTCHVKNTGRCKELLIEGVTVLLEYHPGALEAGRKTEYSLIGVYKGDLLINMDSQAPNQVAMEWLRDGGFSKETGLEIKDIRREVTYGKSRFDLAFLADGKPAYMEVKGVTLEENGIARFPDAPTQRGVKHLLELGKAVDDGYVAYVLFVIQMKGIKMFTPNMTTHPAFGEALRDVAAEGVHVLAYDCVVKKNQLIIDKAIPVVLPAVV